MSASNISSNIFSNIFNTGIELEETYAAIPPNNRLWYQRTYLWYRRHFWYILALGGTIISALIIWDLTRHNCASIGGNKGRSGQSGGASMLAKYGAKRASQLKSGIKGAPGATMAGIKGAPKAVFKGVGKGATAFKNASSVIYKWLFIIFIMFAIGIFIMPTVAMIVLGVLTFYIARGSLKKTVSI